MLVAARVKHEEHRPRRGEQEDDRAAQQAERQPKQGALPLARLRVLHGGSIIAALDAHGQQRRLLG